MTPDILITLEKAFQLCQAHREKNGVRMFSQCWGCIKASKEVPEKMCFHKPPNHDGCRFVNKQFLQANSQ